MRSSLAIKFNVVLLALFIGSFCASALFANHLLQKNAREALLAKARMLMGAAQASSAFTVQHILPLLQDRLAFELLPQLLPSFVANTQLQQMLKAYPDFHYRHTTLDPTHSRNRATGWEAELVEHLRGNPQLRDWVGERDGNNGPTLLYAQPILVSDPACLACHTSPDTAPKSQIELYGRDHGFGWTLNETVGARIVSVPLAAPLQQASERLHTVMLWLLVVFTLLYGALSLTFHLLVTRRLKAMSDIAERVSLGEKPVPAIDSRGHDELARMGRAFTRMRTSLTSAMNMLQK